MKNIVSSLLLIFLFLISCKYHDSRIDKECLPGNILIVYLGGEEVNKPISPCLIQTNSNDTSYNNYIGDSKYKFEKNGFIISEAQKSIIRRAEVSEKVYDKIKEYILNNKKIDGKWPQKKGTYKIIIEDLCDSVGYLISEEDSTYFTDLAEITKEFQNNQLKYIWNYCSDHQN